MKSTPLVSVVILTYGRWEDLFRAVESALGQRGEAKEIIVIDNAGDGICDEVRNKYPAVACHEMEENLGCAARNEGVRRARGEYVVTIDNDVAFAGETALDAVRDFFEHHPKAGCASFKVLGKDGGLSLRDWCHPRDFARWHGEEFLTDHVAEGASAFRKDMFEGVGGYYAPLIIGHEGRDLSLRLMKAGHEVYYTPTVEVLHYAAVRQRSDRRAYYFNTRNNIWIYYMHYPTLPSLRSIAFYTLMMFAYAVRQGRVGAFLSGFKDGIGGLGKITRAPMADEAWSRVAQIKKFKPGMLKRLKKHIISGEKYR